MTKYYGDTNFIGYSGFSKKPKKNPLVKALKIFCWFLGVLLIIIGCGLWVVTSYFSPERIIKIIEEQGSEYLYADIHIGNLNYKLFKTYPWLEVEIDSVTIISKSLDDLPLNTLHLLPSNSDSLATIIQLKGQVNIHDLILKKINLKGIEIVKPRINLVMANDSVSNFNITPSLAKNTKVPEIQISEIRVTPPVDVDFFSLQNDAEANLDIESFYLAQGDDKIYHIGFDGSATGRYENYSLQNKIPLNFSVALRPEFPNFNLMLDHLSMSLSELSLDLKGDIKAINNNIKLESADLNIKVNDIFKLINFLPPSLLSEIPMPYGISGNLPVELSARLERPFSINLNHQIDFNFINLPFVAAKIFIENGNLEFCPPQGKKIIADDLYLKATCNINPENSEETTLIINELRITGEGISLAGQTEIKNLTGEQQNLEGRFNFQSTLMKSLSYLIPNSGINIDGHVKGILDFKGKILNFGKDGVTDIVASGDLESSSLKLNINNSGDVNLKHLKGDYDLKIPAYPISNYAGTKFDLAFEADTITSHNSFSNIIIGGFDIKLTTEDTVAINSNPSGILTLHLKSLKVNSGLNKLEADKVDFRTSGYLLSNPATSYESQNVESKGNDKIIESRIKHTPLVLEYNGSSPLQTVMNMLSVESDLTIGCGTLKMSKYLLPINFTNLCIFTDLDKVKFKTSKVELGASGFNILGEFDGLKPFMTSYNVTPITASLDIDFSNVDINELSWGYFGALEKQGQDNVYYVPPVKPYTANDSICVVIPRNIDADIRLKSKKAEYLGYSFSPLSTDILIENGNATLRDLTIGSPYCKLAVNWTYSTAKLDNIYMNLSANLNDFNFKNFYSTFPNIIEKAPELQNLTGDIDADIKCNFEMFPDMFMNAQSLRGNFDVRGSGFEFVRKGKIERLTHLMLIEGDEPIKIQNLKITGAYHDNLFQLNPFKINFDGYQIGVAGVNNTGGDMYYHISVEKSPFHLPFGVSFFGKMKHPQVRVGGTHIDDFRTEEVSSDTESKIEINIMAVLKNGWQIFIQEAAKYESTKRKTQIAQ